MEFRRARRWRIDGFVEVVRLNVAEAASFITSFTAVSNSGYNARISSDTSILTRSTVDRILKTNPFHQTEKSSVMMASHNTPIESVRLFPIGWFRFDILLGSLLPSQHIRRKSPQLHF